jgi:hypothetical protein
MTEPTSYTGRRVAVRAAGSANGEHGGPERSGSPGSARQPRHTEAESLDLVENGPGRVVPSVDYAIVAMRTLRVVHSHAPVTKSTNN